MPTHEKVVAEMLKIANVKKADVLYDLGSGDGRIVITAAKKLRHARHRDRASIPSAGPRGPARTPRRPE